jgi:chemotaxis protein MotB
MADKKCPECPKCLPGWLVQFGDLMSLLLTFFILLLSMAVMDKKKVEEYIDVMKKAMGFLPDNADVRYQTDKYSDKTADNADGEDSGSASETDTAAAEIQEVMQSMNESTSESSQMEIEIGKNEFTLDIPSSLLFEGNEYRLTSQNSKRFISKIARVIRTMPQMFSIEITGHTDRNSFRSKALPRDNWDISALRAISVVKELIKNRIDPGQLKVSAYSSYHPKSDNALENRRVELRFFSDANQQETLEEENFFDRLEE